MANQKLFPAKIKLLRIMKHFYVQFFFKVTIHPHIMIAHKKFNYNSIVGKLCKLSQNSYKTFRHYFFILVPKVEQVAENKNMRCIIFYLIQKLYNSFFTGNTAFIIGSAEMKVGNEIYFFL